ncbi:unnamed protein product, partial [Closterium sp. NIES-54]
MAFQPRFVLATRQPSVVAISTKNYTSSSRSGPTTPMGIATWPTTISQHALRIASKGSDVFGETRGGSAALAMGSIPNSPPFLACPRRHVLTDADGENAEAAVHATGATVDASAESDDEADAEARTEEETEADADAVAPADVAAIADADADAGAEADTDAVEGGADAVLFDGENSDDDPWSITGDDDVPLLKRRLRHCLQSKPKRARVVLSDDDSPGEECQPRITAADKGKSKVAEAPAKATIRRRTSNKKRKNDGDPGYSTGAAKKKRKTPNKDDIVFNEALGSDDDYTKAAGPIPSFPEKANPKDPTLHNPKSRPPSPRSKDSPVGASPRLSPRPEPLSPQQLRRWFAQHTRLWNGAAGARDPAARDTGGGGAGVTAGAGGPGGAAAASRGGARTRETGAAGTGTGAGGAKAGGAAAGGTGAGGAGAGGAGAVHPGAGGSRAGGAGGTGAGDT